jgi:general secretion pathway protein M
MSALDKLEPRERKLLLGLGVAFAAVLLVLVPYLTLRRIRAERAAIQELHDVAQTVRESQKQMETKRAARNAVLARYAKPAPPLGAYLDELASQQGLVAAESTDRPEIPHGKKFSERVTVVRMHKVSMLPFAKMMERIAQSPHPVAVSKLSLKPRIGEPDQYEIELGLSAYDRKGDPVAAASAAPTASAAAAPDDRGAGDDDDDEGDGE